MAGVRVLETEQGPEFHLVGKTSVYAFCVGAAGMLVHLHWGRLDHSVAKHDLPSFKYLTFDCVPQAFDPHVMQADQTPVFASRNALPLEFSVFGTGDYHQPSVDIKDILDLVYDSFSIHAGKPKIDPTLPAFYVESEQEASTLCVTLKDTLTGLKIHLYYTVFHEYDAIARRVVVDNQSTSQVTLASLMAATVDFPVAQNGYTFSHLSGSWARERYLVSSPLKMGSQRIQSNRGASSHQHNPFAIISNGDYNEDSGEHFAFGFVYSGSFFFDAEISQTGRLRTSMGMDPLTFQWTLPPNEQFTSPEVIMVFSANGVGEISRQLHRLIRTRLVRGYWRDRQRPILVNSWEAMYFNVNESAIVDKLAKPAATLGFDLVVIDDGWFGERSSDHSSLGDWVVNKDKFPNGLKGVCDQVNALGLQLGIWMEPEMINVDSSLFREHPDWPLHVPNRPRSESRNQLVLDLSRKDVQDFIVQAVTSVLSSANISYLKWDFNRSLTEVGSGQVYHRYVLGLYSVLERITTAFPRVLFESCSGGGGRYDLGMLHYMPQTWTSDNTDAITRQKIQYGTLIAYPATTMSCHVSKVPNHQHHRSTALRTRAHVAMAGIYGYELDLTEVSDKETNLIKEHIAISRSIDALIRCGDLYRLASPFRINNHGDTSLTSWLFVAENRESAVLFCFNSEYHELVRNFPRLRLQGLDPQAIYQLEGDEDGQHLGAVLMSSGIVIEFFSDAQSFFCKLTKVATTSSLLSRL